MLNYTQLKLYQQLATCSICLAKEVHLSASCKACKVSCKLVLILSNFSKVVIEAVVFFCTWLTKNQLNIPSLHHWAWNEIYLSHTFSASLNPPTISCWSKLISLCVTSKSLATLGMWITICNCNAINAKIKTFF